MSRYSNLMIAQGATHHWSFDELSGTSASDTIGVANLTSIDLMSRETPAVVKSCLLYAASKYAYQDSNTTMQFIETQPFSFSYIFKNTLALTSGNARGIISRRNNATTARNFSAFLFYNNPNVQGALTIDFGDNQARWNTTFKPVVGTWYHNAVTWDPSTSSAQLYVNGAFSQSSSLAPTQGGATANFRIGALGGGENGQNFVGPIDEVAVFKNKLLSVDEIAAQYNTAFPMMRIFDGTNWQDADKKVL